MNNKAIVFIINAIFVAAGITAAYFIKESACSSEYQYWCIYINICFYGSLAVGGSYLLRDRSKSNEEWFNSICRAIGILVVFLLTAPFLFTLPFVPFAILIWGLFEHTLITFVASIIFFIALNALLRQ
jgi:hypothetical protein